LRVQGSRGEVQSSRFKVQGSDADKVISQGVKFLVNSARSDGSWPIDTNLATWNTTLAINALAGAGEDVAALLGPQCLDWLLACQHTQRHPFTGADPGGFGWSDLSGAVPDADDTPGAMLALASWSATTSATGVDRSKCAHGYLEGLYWLQYLHNGDGGWPTFCRGWGRLPFDRSGADLTAHVLRAVNLYGRFDEALGRDALPRKVHSHVYHATKAIEPALHFLALKQNQSGSWSPLWFGNQDHPSEENLVYGTAKVLMAYRDLGLMDSPEARRGVGWLVANQNEDGGWGSGVWQMRNAEFGVRSGQQAGNAEPGARSGDELFAGAVPGTQYSGLSTGYPVLSTALELRPGIANPKSKIQNLKSSIEETSLAVEALLAACERNATEGVPYSALARGLAWLMDRVEQGQHHQRAPIGLYFAKLWYYERLYPLIFATAALGRACRQFARPKDATSTDEPSESRAR
jgi:squalene-hopene/tetraprenyl-beta-curcumene cyclase